MPSNLPFDQEAISHSLSYLLLPDAFKNAKSKPMQQAQMVARCHEESLLELGYLNPDWKEVGIKWQSPPTDPAPPSPTKSAEV